jgi:signal transduction histidine kinase
VFREGRSTLSRQVTDAHLQAAARDAEHLALLRELAPRSAIMVPLLVRGRVVGVITLAIVTAERSYQPSDLALAEDLARRAAQAIDNSCLYREAQEAIRARDQFFSVASHELKTPLTSLLGYAELVHRRASQQGALQERDMRALQVVVKSAGRLNTLVDSLLDLSRIATGQLSIVRIELDLVALTHRVVAEVQPMLEQHTVALGGVPGPLIVEGDEMRLEQVLRNLIGNAIKYSPAGGPIAVTIERRGDQACVAVRDEGIGIPRDALPQLFQRFYRARNTEPQQISGMGIGLYVVKEIVTLHGGTVTVESVEGQGSTFTICLPLFTTKTPSHQDTKAL